MRRRQILAAIGTTISFAGCLSVARGSNPDDEAPSPTREGGVDITVPTGSPGETVTITITAQSVTHLRFSTVPDNGPSVEYENAVFSPTPSAVWQRRPPTWQWSASEHVTGEIPLTVPETVDAGDYQFGIAIQHDNSDEELTERFTVPVEE